jgi:Flp pilus assembly protein TadD
VAALEGWGIALWKDKRPREALEVLDRVLQKEPRRELALSDAALVALELGDAERSIGYWRRLLEVNPHTWSAHGYYGQALALKQQWSEAVRECREALRINPFEMRTRMLLIDCLVHLPDIKSARAEFETLLALPASKPEQLRPWFDELLRSGG